MSSFVKKYWLWVVASVIAVLGIGFIGGKTILVVFVLTGIGGVLFVKPLWTLYLLVPSLFLEAEQFSMYIGDWRGRVYHFLVAILVVRMVYEWIIPPRLPAGDTPPCKGGDTSPRPSPYKGEGGRRLDKALIVFLAVQGVAIVASPDKGLSIKIWVLQVLLALLFWSVRYFVKTQKEWRRLLTIFLISSVVEALIGFWQVFAFYLQKTTGIVLRWGEVFHAQILQFGRPYGTFVEADWYGAFMAIPLMMSIVLMAGAWGKKMRFLYGALSVIFGIAVVISGVRAAWIAVIVGAGIGLVVLKKCDANIRMHTNYTNSSRIPHPRPLLEKERGYDSLYKEYKHLVGMGVIGVVVIGILVSIASPAWAGQIGERFISMFQPSVWTQEPRVATMMNAVELIAQSPIIGHGPGSYKVLGIVPDVDPSRYDYYGVHPYLTNYFLTVLHDSGIIGLGVFLWVLVEGVKVGVLSLRVPLRGAKQSRDTEIASPCRSRNDSIGWGAVMIGVITLMIAYLITTGFWLGMTWFLFGLLASVYSLIHE